MQKYFASKLFFILILFFLGLPSKAQETCSAKLDRAKELFSSGQIEEIPSLLDSCLQNGFTREEKIQADLLLIQIYLFDSNREKADTVMTDFLRDFPDYKIQPDDPVEFTELYKLFKIKPTWGVGIIAGVNLPHVSVLEHFSTENLNELNSSYSPDGVGFDFGLHVNKYFRQNIWISFDIQYSIINFKRSEILGNNREELKYSEKTGWVSAPLYFNLSFGKGRLSPYVFAGADFGYLMVDKSYIVRHNMIDNTIPDIIQKSKDIRNNREPVNIWSKTGMGLNYKALGGYFNFSVGYNYCFMPFVKSRSRYIDNDILYYYQYVEDDFKIDPITCSFGYTKPFYRIKKKKE